MRQLFQVLAWAAMIVFIATSCMQKPDQPTTPTGPTTARIVPDSEYCHTIAPMAQQRLAVGTKGKYWTTGQTVRVGFIGGAETMRQTTKDAFAEWAKHVNLVFTYPAAGPYDLRIAYNQGGGSWSYIGTDCKGIPQTSPTTNIGWSGLAVQLHELGHAIGASHEQSSPNSDIQWNKPVVYAALGGPPNLWSKETVDWNVFRKLTTAEAEATVFDPASIMQYSVPGSWTFNYPNGIAGGSQLSAYDKLFWSTKYPKSPAPGTGITITTADRDSLLKWSAERKAAMVGAAARATTDDTKTRKILLSQ